MRIVPVSRSWLFCLGLVSGSVLAVEQETYEQAIHADGIIENADSSKTFFKPRILIGTGKSAEYHRISRGVPGVCRLFGMDGFLKDYVIRSEDSQEAITLADDGSVAGTKTGRTIESVTCTQTQSYQPVLLAESIEQHPDGSITASMPGIYTGPENFRIVSGHVTGACRLLGFNQARIADVVWSEQSVMGVSMALDGQIYGPAAGTYLTSIVCENVSKEKYSSPGRVQFEDDMREYNEQHKDDMVHDDMFQFSEGGDD